MQGLFLSPLNYYKYPIEQSNPIDAVACKNLRLKVL